MLAKNGDLKNVLSLKFNVTVEVMSMFIILEDTKGVIRSRKSKKYRQHNGQKKKDKQIEQNKPH